MFFNKDETTAQFVDRFLKRIALSVSILALSYGSGALSHIVGGEARDILLMVKDPLGLLAALIVLPMFIKMMVKVIRSGKASGDTSSGYVAEIYGKSAGNGFAAGFIFLIFTEPMSDGWLAHLPPSFFVQAAIAVLLGSLGISFFILNRDTGDEMDDGFDDEEGAVQ